MFGEAIRAGGPALLAALLPAAAFSRRDLVLTIAVRIDGADVPLAPNIRRPLPW